MRSNLAFCLPAVLLLYSIYSYSQVDPNLVLSSNSTYWSFQQYMWQLGYHQRPLSTLIFASLTGLMFLLYALIIHLLRTKQLGARKMVVVFALSAVALLPSYPALSHDVFNYLMNAKIMAVYHSSPYLHAAWDFPAEPWLSFMHNIEVVTPYGYAWTGIGYLTFLLAGGDLQFGLLAFRLLAVLAVAVTALSLAQLSKKHPVETAALFLFNPLVLTEAIGNMHNDMVMMAIFVAGAALCYRWWPHKRWLALGTLVGLWTVSVLTKLVTIIMPATYLLTSKLPTDIKKHIDWAGLSAAAFVGLMFFDGSKRFYTWYLLWPLSVVFLSSSSVIKKIMVTFTLSGCLSYVFYLYIGEYNPTMLLHRIIFLFAFPVFYTGMWILKNRSARS